MKALSLWQPWASLWLTDRKIHETRHWKVQVQVPVIGFWLAVHAAKKLVRDVDPDLRAILEAEFGANWAKELPTGAILGRVLVTACIPTREFHHSSLDRHPSLDDQICGNFGPGRYAWRRKQFERLAQPVPWKGSQGLFRVPESIFEKDAT